MKKLTENDILKLYLLLDKLNEIFHDPERASNQKIINRFIKNYYPTIHKLYYETIWNALSIMQRKEILGEDFTIGSHDKDHFISQEYSLEEKDLMKLKDSL